MISPHTKSGTKIVCIDASGVGPNAHIDKGAVYTVARIGLGVQWNTGATGIGVFLVEHDEANCFDLSRFRYLDLPRSLTSLLNVTPVWIDGFSTA
jgi:hypothetical protein